MKVGIRQTVLVDALEKGSLAAITKEAQTDTSNLSLLIKSIKITAGKKITIESATDLIAVKYDVPASSENGIVVKEEGSVLISAQEFITWVKAQSPDATITMSLSKLATPEVINMVEDIDDDGDNFSIKKIGSVKLTSKDPKNTTAKWELDCYDPNDVPKVDFKHKSQEKHFDIDTDQLTEGLSNVSFSALKQDYEHILDSVSMQTYKSESGKNVYFATTDTKRCALYKVPDSCISDIQSDNPILVLVSLLDMVSKVASKEEKISFLHSPELNRVFVSQSNLSIRLASAEKEMSVKFPNINSLIEKKYKLLATVPKTVLNGLLLNAAIVNSSSALFDFDKEANSITVKAVSDDNKYKPNVKKASVDKVSKDVKVVWGVTHLLQALNVIKSDEVQMYAPDNLKSVKLLDEGLSYFAMTINNPKYEV